MKLFRDMRIGKKLLLGFTILMLFKIALGIYSYFLAEDVFNTMDNIRVIQEQQNMFDKFRAGHNNNLYVATDMINTGKVPPQRPQTHTECLLGKWYYNDFQKYSNKQIDEGINSRYSEEEIEILKKLEKPHVAFHESLIEIYQIVKNDNSKEGKEKALKVLNERTKPSAEMLMSTLEEYNEAASKRAESRRSYAMKNVHLSMIALIVTIVIMLLISVIISTIIRKDITRTVSQLSKAFEKITGGDLTSRVHIRSKDEGGYLGECFNKMAEELSEMMSEINIFSGNVNRSSFQLETKSKEFLSLNKEYEANLKELGSMLNNITNHVQDLSNQMPQTTQKNDKGIESEKAFRSSLSDIKNNYSSISTNVEEFIKHANQIQNITSSMDDITNQLSNVKTIKQEEDNDKDSIAEVAATVESDVQINQSIDKIYLQIDQVSKTAKDMEKVSKDQSEVLQNNMKAFENILNSIENIIPEGKNNEFTSDHKEKAIKILDAARKAVKISNNILETNNNQVAKIEEISNISTELSNESKNLREKISIFKV